MITKDKYGFIEETEEAKPPARKGGLDFIGMHLKSPGYIENYVAGAFRFSRFYWSHNLAIDLFKKAGTEIEAEARAKRKFCRKHKIRYIPIEKGGNLTARELKNYVKGD